MKVLVISNVPDAAEGIVNALDGAGFSIVEKEADSIEKMADTADDAISKGYSSVIAITDNPMGAGIAMNKRENVRAVVCETGNDAKAAKRNKANTIIVDDGLAQDDLSELLSTLTNVPIGEKVQQPRKMQAVQPKRQPAPQAQPENPTNGFQWSDAQDAPAPKPGWQMPSFMKPTPQVQPAPEQDEEPEEEFKTARPGLIGKIKDSLGIIDADATSQPQEKGPQAAQPQGKKPAKS